MNNNIFKLPSYIQKFKRGDKIVLINPEIPSWIVTNELGELIINLFDGNNTIDDIIDIVTDGLGKNYTTKIAEFCDVVVNSGIFNEKTTEIRNKYRLHIIHLSLAQNCNLKCLYCYAEERKETGLDLLTLDEYKILIDDILSINKNSSFTITGGEPLLCKYWKEIAEYIKNYGNETILLSNGTLFNQANIKDIKRLFDKVCISIDGSSEKIHNATRGNNYKKVINAIELLENNNIHYELSMTVTKNNIFDVENMAKKYGAKLKFQPLFPVSNLTEDKLSITGEEYFNALKQASGVNPLSYCEKTLANSQIKKCHKCAMGDGEISISATGDVYPCQLLHDEKFYAGNVKKQKITDIYYNSPKLNYCQTLTVDNIEGCKDCAFKYICGGACRARSFFEVGDIAKNGDFCVYEKNAFLDGIINLYSNNILSQA